jgi:hypothetical protein
MKSPFRSLGDKFQPLHPHDVRGTSQHQPYPIACNSDHAVWICQALLLPVNLAQLFYRATVTVGTLLTVPKVLLVVWGSVSPTVGQRDKMRKLMFR